MPNVNQDLKTSITILYRTKNTTNYHVNRSVHHIDSLIGTSRTNGV